MAQTVETAPIPHCITVDLEDWIQSVYDPTHPLTSCFHRNTYRVLEVLRQYNTKGTFFVLGLVAERAPDLVRELQAAGHEIQSHGYAHHRAWEQTPSQFRSDILRSKKLLEDIIGCPVTGYRAPVFSIGRVNPWAIDVLVECGFRYDSSIFPVRTRRYGLSGFPEGPHHLTTPHGNRLLELPVASYHLGPVRLPAGGGGYARLFPRMLFRRAIRQLSRAGSPAVLYVHPYEFAPEEFNELPVRVPWRLRYQQRLGRRGMVSKIGGLLGEFRFAPLRQIIPRLRGLPTVCWPEGTVGVRQPVDSERCAHPVIDRREAV